MTEQPMKLSKHSIQQAFDELAPDYDRRLWFDSHILGVERLRRQLMRQAEGRILDLACGTGANFKYFPAISEIVGVDLSPGMLEVAQATALGLNIAVQLYEMDAERLTFADDSFDTVVSALSTCTFVDPIRALQEIGRVCRPGGQVLLLEHGRSKVDRLAAYQEKTAAAHYEAHAGCRWNQDPIELIKEAGLQLVSVDRATLGVFYMIKATV